jgi:hypothetical protein
MRLVDAKVYSLKKTVSRQINRPQIKPRLKPRPPDKSLSAKTIKRIKSLGIFIIQTSDYCYYFQAAGKDFGSMGRGEGGREGGGGGGGAGVGVGAAGEGGLWINPLAR